MSTRSATLSRPDWPYHVQRQYNLCVRRARRRREDEYALVWMDWEGGYFRLEDARSCMAEWEEMEPDFVFRIIRKY